MATPNIEETKYPSAANAAIVFTLNRSEAFNVRNIFTKTPEDYSIAAGIPKYAAYVRSSL